MSRLASVAKMGYYPLPEALAAPIAAGLHAPHGGRLLDPCAGAGQALELLAGALNLEAYGIELNDTRAQQAAARLEPLTARALPHRDPPGRRVLHAAAQSVRATAGGFNVVYANPPYDHDEQDGRLEYRWLLLARQWLQPGGILIYVVPQHILGRGRVARYLASWFDDVTVTRFPDGLYERFRQVVLCGTRKPRALPPATDQIERYRQLAAAGTALTPLAAPDRPRYRVPRLTVASKRFVFRSLVIDPAQAQAEASAHGARTLPAWKEQLAPDAAPAEPVRPLMPLKIGHLASLIAAGFLNSRVLARDGERLLIKGAAYKDTRTEQVTRATDDGGEELVTTATEHVVTRITALAPNGTVQTLSGQNLTTFLKRWMPELTAHVTEAYPPSYDFDYANSPYRTIIDRLSLSRRIPHLNHAGLFRAQKHVTAALAAHLETRREALLVGEMGVGKTSIGVALAACRRARRTLVLCPPHLVGKWMREATIVWPALEVHELTTLSDVDAFFIPGGDRPRLGVLSHSRAKLGSGWINSFSAWEPSPAARKRYLLQAAARGLDPEQATARLALYLARRGARCPSCGALIRDREGLPAARQTVARRRKRSFCGRCDGALFQFDRRRTKQQQPGSFAGYAARERQIRRALAAPTPWNEPVLAPGYFAEPAGYARFPLADYILQRYRGQIDLGLFDEVHEFKGADSDQGYAFHALVCASRKVVGLTGTIFGGKSSTLFHLLYRLAPNVRRAFTDTEAGGRARLQLARWVDLYGVRQSVEKQKIDERSGKLSGKTRSNVTVREIPGASPAMMVWLLNRCVFLSLRDMGLALPDYREMPVAVEPDGDMLALYHSLRSQLQGEMNERLARGDRSLLGAFLQSLLSWVDGPWREEIIIDPKTRDKEEQGIEPQVVAAIPGLDAGARLFPKEQAIIERIRREKAAGRRCVLYCQQTNTRDITPRWLDILQRAGLKAAVLKCAPNKREAWIAKQVERGVDVVITHPRRVATGLDLLDFPTLIFMGIEYSSYIVAQAARRSWRIGQDQPVKVYFYYYAGTLQDDALHLIAAKIAANTRVNGDVVGENSLAELDSGGHSIEGALARIALADERRAVADLNELFAQANEAAQDENSILGEYEIVDNRPVVGDDGREKVAPVTMPAPDNRQENGTRRPVRGNNAAPKLPVAPPVIPTGLERFVQPRLAQPAGAEPGAKGSGKAGRTANGHPPAPVTGQTNGKPAGTAPAAPPAANGPGNGAVPRPRLVPDRPDGIDEETAKKSGRWRQGSLLDLFG